MKVRDGQLFRTGPHTDRSSTLNFVSGVADAGQEDEAMFTAAKVTLMVKDVNRSVKFYGGILGLRQTVRYGNVWVEFEAPGTVIALHPNRKPKTARPPKTISIGFQVKNLDASMKELRKKGLALTLAEEGFLRRADFTDPDGHMLYLMEVR